MFVLLRSIIYASIFIGFFLVFMPAQILNKANIIQPEAAGFFQASGMIIVIIGAMLVLWCLLTFVFIGRGTPAPFDPPRRLVIKGPYKYVRNPMYIGATFILIGAAMYYHSFELSLYTSLFWGSLHIFIVYYEEPSLKERFATEYTSYQQKVNRWLPKF